jgi:PST family polysaccharide transporter
MAAQLSALIRLGLAFTIGGIALLVGQLAMRTLVQRDLGLDALGYFQAAWFISITYIGFVLQAMGTDYYPRLTATIHDHSAANRLVNEQTEVAMLLAAPVLLGLLALAPWVVQLLYSSAFGEAVIVLRWQILGDALKIASWPMGFILLATGDARAYMISETVAVAVMVGTTALLLPIIGLQACGVAVLVMYLFYLPLVHQLARRRTRLCWQASVTRLFWLVLIACSLTFTLAWWNDVAGALFGSVAAAAFAVLAFVRLGDALPGPIRVLRQRMRH